jgi:hypothetical protein
MQSPGGGGGTDSARCFPHITTKGAGGGARYPLICGEEGCPTSAPTERACGGPRLLCVYPGLDNDYGGWDLTVRCECVDQEWVCVQSTAEGWTNCPIPLRESGPCDPAVTPQCLYPAVGQPWSADCVCGGDVPHDWICLL